MPAGRSAQALEAILSAPPERPCRFAFSGLLITASRTLAGSIAYRIEENDRLMIFDAQGTLLAEYPWPKPGIKYVGSGNPRGPRGPPKTKGLSEMS
ncbi:hypothetical protein ACPPVQ_17455 [Diaminobutyricibacter sp. McL0618]|uniref:hypothetical protein n=1 Tax=Leifsonia sp. McL0618 TaxID=3415677 RepID=UPI003CE7E5E5